LTLSSDECDAEKLNAKSDMIDEMRLVNIDEELHIYDV